MEYVYNYHPITKEYLNSEPLYRDPIENLPVLPPDSTTIVPPEKTEDHVAVFKDDKWELVEDYRGQPIYKNGEVDRVVDTIGAVPDGWFLDKSPERLLNDEVSKKTGEIKTYSESNTIQEFFVDGYNFTISLEEVQRQQSFLSLAERRGETEIKFPLLFRVYIVEKNKLRKFLDDIEIYKRDCILTTLLHIRAINQIASPYDVAQYNNTLNYPSKPTLTI